MNKQDIKNKLLAFDLTSDEIDLYIFLSENGAHTPLEISRQCGINRSKIYRLIETMQGKKLIEDSKSSWGQKLKAAPIENLSLLIASKENEIEKQKEILPQLVMGINSLPPNSSKGFEFKTYKGQEGLKQMLWNELKAKEVVLFGYTSINEPVGKKFANIHRGEAARRNIHYYEISNIREEDYNDSPGWDKVFKIKFISPKLLNIKHLLQIYNNTVAIINYIDGEFFGIEIINKSFADMQRQIFWHYWDIAKEYKGKVLK